MLWSWRLGVVGRHGRLRLAFEFVLIWWPYSLYHAEFETFEPRALSFLSGEKVVSQKVFVGSAKLISKLRVIDIIPDPVSRRT